jgi:ribosomal protein L22
MEAHAKLKNCPMSARKMRLVVDNIRGKSVDDAFNILKYTNKEAAGWVEKLLFLLYLTGHQSQKWQVLKITDCL